MQIPLPALAMVGLLAFLALAPGCVIPRSRTVDALWYKEGEKGKAPLSLSCHVHLRAIRYEGLKNRGAVQVGWGRRQMHS